MFKDRIDAGKKLAEKLAKYKEKKDLVVLGIPRGGVVLARIVSETLGLPLDVIIIKKIGFPGNEEFAIGAASSEDFHIDEDRVKEFGVDREFIDEEVKTKKKEAKERYDFLFAGRREVELRDKDVILIDDGIATGESMRLAVELIRKGGAKKIIVAVPVASEDLLGELRADEVVCLLKVKSLGAVGEFYEDFSPVEDSEVKELLR